MFIKFDKYDLYYTILYKHDLYKTLILMYFIGPGFKV